jgi:ssDNA-binding Zn-finger/Zn-ribbon topoisomerase 1
MARALNHEKLNRNKPKPLRQKKSYSKIYPKNGSTPDAPHCNLCGGYMLLRSDPYGDFYGCVQYPKCLGKTVAFKTTAV